MTPTQTQPKPKFTDQQEVQFKITFTATALIDGEPEWDENEQAYLYPLSAIQVSSDPEEDYSVTSFIAINNNENLFWQTELIAADSLPSCEFDPN